MVDAYPSIGNSLRRIMQLYWRPNRRGMDRLKRAAPVAPAGPGGAHFEGQVGAHYLLTMLAGGAPRGLPGTIIDSVAFQRADDHPLDDVVVRAHDAAGKAATLEIQVKRSVRFTAGDEVFADVVEQLVKASNKA